MKILFKLVVLIIIAAVVGVVLMGVFHPTDKTDKNQNATSTAVATNKNPSTGKSIAIPVNVVVIKDTASSSPSVNIEYPQFSSLSKDFNALIKSSVTTRLIEFKKDSTDNYTGRVATAPKGSPVGNISDFSMIVKWTPAQINSSYVSFIIRYDSYTGGANENQQLETYNFDVAKNKNLTLADLFPSSSDYLTQISKISRTKLAESMRAASDSEPDMNQINDGTTPTAENFANFTFTDDIVTIYFPKYAVGPGAFGEQKVTIQRSSIK